MLPSQGRQMAQEFIWDVFSRGVQGIDGPLHINSVPEDDRGHDKVETAGAMLLVLRCPVADAAKAVKADGAGKRVAGLAFVQFSRGLAAERRVFQPVQGEQRPLDAPDLTQRQGQPVLPRVGAEALQHEGRGYDAGSDRGGQPQQVLPMRLDQPFIDLAGDERLQVRPCRGRAEGVEPPVMQIRNTRREAEAHQMAEGKDMVRDTAPIDMVDGDLDIRAMVEKAVDDMGRLALGHGDGFGVVGRVTIGDVGVEGNGGAGTLMWVDGPSHLSPSTEREMLAIGTGGCAATEEGRQRLRLLDRNDPGQSPAIGVLADVPPPVVHMSCL